MSLTSTNGHELARVPFAPGDAPFKIKGVAYKGHLEYTDRFVPGGVEAMKQQFRDPKLTRFFEQPFLAASMYDVFPLAQAGVACADLTKLSFAQFLRIRSRVQAETDIKGVYKFLMNLVSGEAIAKRIPKIIGTYFDFVETEIASHGPNEVEGFQRGLPDILAPWYSLTASTYLETALTLAGKTAPGTDMERHPTGGRSHGLSLTDVRFHVRWR
jgi:hypothetical protein